MSDSIPLRLQQSEVQLLREALDERWQQEHEEAMRASDCDFLVGKCLQLPAGMELSWRITCREAVAGQVTNGEERARTFANIFDQAIQVATRTHDRAGAFSHRTGHVIEGLTELEAAIRELQQMKEKYVFRLSLLDDEVIREAAAEHAVEPYATPGEALADLLAARHAEKLLPSSPELRRWADRSPPGPSWFEEEPS